MTNDILKVLEEYLNSRLEKRGITDWIYKLRYLTPEERRQEVLEEAKKIRGLDGV